jgi:hypothetical protein
MAKKLQTVDELQDYFVGVVKRAEHHAQNVEEIIYPLLGMIIAFKDKKNVIEVWTQNGETGNLLWAKINGTRYAFKYVHTPVSIEIRKNNYKGNIVNTITNKNTLKTLRNVFKNL